MDFSDDDEKQNADDFRIYCLDEPQHECDCIDCTLLPDARLDTASVLVDMDNVRRRMALLPTDIQILLWNYFCETARPGPVAGADPPRTCDHVVAKTLRWVALLPYCPAQLFDDIANWLIGYASLYWEPYQDDFIEAE